MGTSPSCSSPSCSACCTDLGNRIPVVDALSEAPDTGMSPTSFCDATTKMPSKEFTTGIPAAAVPAAMPALSEGGPLAAASAPLSVQTQSTEERKAGPSANGDLQSDVDSCELLVSPSENTLDAPVPDIGQAQNIVKKFVRSFVRGVKVNVLTVNSTTVECIAFLDRQLTTLSLQRLNKKDSKKRPINLHEVHEVCLGEEAGEDVELPVDESCVTLLLDDGNAVGFTFDDVEDRDTFALCIAMFVDGRRNEFKKKGKKKSS